MLGFGGRAIGEDQQPKYVNSTDGPVYHKGRHLFGADIARAAAAKAGRVILCEGYTDVIAMHQAGLRNAVGLMGTSLTEDQVGELARLAPVVLLALDADSAGQEAMIRAAKVAAGRRIELRVVALPPGKDPADLLREPEGAAGMRERVEASVPFVRFRVERELDAATWRARRARTRSWTALRPVFASVPPSALRDELLGARGRPARGERRRSWRQWLAPAPRRAAARGRGRAGAGAGGAQGGPAVPAGPGGDAGAEQRRRRARTIARPDGGASSARSSCSASRCRRTGRAALAELDVEHGAHRAGLPPRREAARRARGRPDSLARSPATTASWRGVLAELQVRAAVARGRCARRSTPSCCVCRWPRSTASSRRIGADDVGAREALVEPPRRT